MSEKNKSLTKEQAILNAKRCIVTHALKVGVGGKLITSQELNAQYGITAGTTQRALNILSETKALMTSSRGHLGRIINHVDTGLCWNIAKLKPVQLLMPRSGSIEINVLIQYITNKLGQLNIPYFITNQAGSKKRMSQINKGIYDLTLVSAATVQEMQDNLLEAQIKIMHLGSYYSDNRLVFVFRQNTSKTDWKRIAIDENSIDHIKFTLMEFPNDERYEYIKTPFNQIPARILNNEIDVGLWHITKSPVPLENAGLYAQKFKRKQTIELHKKISAAVFVASRSRLELVSLFNEINIKEVAKLQKQALANEDFYNKAFKHID